MLDIRRTWVIANFELNEARRSRLATFALGLYAAIAGLGTYSFLRTFAAIEETARTALANATGVDASTIPPNLVRDKAIPMLAALETDPGIREQYLRMDPLGIFYAKLSIHSVVLLVLTVSATAIASELSSGSCRFVLTRCDRLSWSLGKGFGHASLLAVALLLGALVTAAVGLQMDPNYHVATGKWLLYSSFFSWVYGVAHLGLFFGISLLSRSVSQARSRAVFLTIALGIAHAFLNTDLARERLPGATYLVYLFPNHYQDALGSADWKAFIPATLALFLLGSGAFMAGVFGFRRRDA
jgi:ABC-type transport system involved in multi-copper enzyme maturation permease subunit